MAAIGTLFGIAMTAAIVIEETDYVPDGNLVSTQLESSKHSDNFSNFTIWTTNPGEGTVTGYNPDLSVKIVIVVPPPNGSPPGAKGRPSGIVINKNKTDFLITDGVKTPLPALLIVVTQDGSILGYNPSIATSFILIETYNDYSFQGLAIVGGFLFATTYRNNQSNNNIIKFNNKFNDVTVDGSFPLNIGGIQFTNGLVCAYGINVVRDLITVTYISLPVNSTSIKYRRPLTGPGFGFVNQYNTNGEFIRRVVNPNNNLNVPYDPIQVRDYSFKDANSKILISNSGDGSLQLFNFVTGKHEFEFQDNRLLGIKGIKSIRSGKNHDGGHERFYFAGGILGPLGPDGNNGPGFIGYIKFNKHNPCDKLSLDVEDIKLNNEKKSKKLIDMLSKLEEPKIREHSSKNSKKKSCGCDK